MGIVEEPTLPIAPLASIVIAMEKKRLKPITKIKLMLLIEYLVFVVIFAVIGVLFLTDVIKVAEWKRYAFTYITLAGGVWIIVDFFWTMLSPKHRINNSRIDKILLLPAGLTLVVFDIYAIAQGCAETLPYRYFIGGDLCYLSAVYLFEAIFHWFHPIQGVVDAALEAREEEQEKLKKEKEEKEEPKQ